MLLICLYDYRMEDETLAFKAGCVYDFYYTDDEWYNTDKDYEDTSHLMHVTMLLKYFGYTGDNI